MSLKTIIDENGKIIYHDTDAFYNNIVLGDDCFICGAKNGTKPFNDEHILPVWLLSQFNLYDKKITLKNLNKVFYRSYTIPCCKECNEELGRRIETPVSKLLKLPYADIAKAFLEDDDIKKLLYQWMVLIFFKCHLKDKFYNWNLDKRIDDGKISEMYDWADMHHLHCIVRQHYTGAIVNINTIGSLFIVQMNEDYEKANFNFMDNNDAQTIMLQLNDFCIIAVLNDSCSTLNIFSQDFLKLRGKLTYLQVLELFSHITYISMNIEEKPTYVSEFKSDGKYHIKAILPNSVRIKDLEQRQLSWGEILHYYCQGLLEKDILDKVRKQEISFLGIF